MERQIVLEEVMTLSESYDEGYRRGVAGDEIGPLPEGADQNAFEHGYTAGEALYFELSYRADE